MSALEKQAKPWGGSITTLRRWEREGKLVPAYPSGGHRRYDVAKLCPERFRAASDVTRKTVAYARVSSHDQKDDRERQKQGLELYCPHLAPDFSSHWAARVSGIGTEVLVTTTRIASPLGWVGASYWR